MTPALYSWTFIPREVKAYVHNNLYVNVHSSLIGNNLNLETTQCPLVGGWSNNSGTSMPQNYLAIIRNKQMISTSAWIDLEGIMWGKNFKWLHSVILNITSSKWKNPIEMENRWVISRGHGWGWQCECDYNGTV